MSHAVYGEKGPPLHFDFITNKNKESALKIFSYLSIQDLCTCASVSRSWQTISENDLLWVDATFEVDECTLIRKEWQKVQDAVLCDYPFAQTSQKSRFRGAYSQLLVFKNFFESALLQIKQRISPHEDPTKYLEFWYGTSANSLAALTHSPTCLVESMLSYPNNLGIKERVFLINYVAHASAKSNKFKFSPLHIALECDFHTKKQRCCIGLIQALIFNNPGLLKSRNLEGLTPLQFAIQENHQPPIVNFLEKSIS